MRTMQKTMLNSSKNADRELYHETNPPTTLPTHSHLFFERPASSIEQSAHRIVLPVLSKSAPSSVLYISTSMGHTIVNTNTLKLSTFQMKLSRLAQGSGRQFDGNPFVR